MHGLSRPKDRRRKPTTGETKGGAKEVKEGLVNGFYCKQCHTVCISTSIHAFVVCGCGNFVDGGRYYSRRGGNVDDMLTVYHINGLLGEHN